jgi:hypothetical protein
MRKLFVGAVLAVAAVAVPVAGAEGTVSGGYAGQAGSVQGQLGSGGLAFTGIDIALVVVGGLALMLFGLVLRRAAAARR